MGEVNLPFACSCWQGALEKKAMVHRGVTLTSTSINNVLALHHGQEISKTFFLNNMRLCTESPANDSAAIMIISCLVSAYELSPRLLRPLSEVSEKSIIISSKFWDRTLSWSSQSFLSYNGTMWFLLHALNIWTVPLAESWVFWNKTSNLATLTKRKQGKFWSLDRGIPWRQHTSNMT